MTVVIEDRRGWDGSNGLAVLGLATALTAAVAGLLYATGAVLVAGQVRALDVPLRDALPLIPLSQMLGRGISVLVGSPLVFMLVLAWIGGSIWFSHWREKEVVDLGRNLDQAHAKLETMVRDLADAKRERESIDLAPLFVDPQADAGDIKRLVTKIRQLDAMLLERSTWVNETVEVSKSLRERFRKATRFDKSVPFWWLTMFGRLASAGVLGLAGSPYSAPFWVAGGLAHLLGDFGRTTRRTASVLSGVLWIFGTLMTAYYYPQHLPAVNVKYHDGRVMSGTLVAQTGEVVVISPEERKLTTLPMGEVLDVQAVSTEGRRSPWLGRPVWEAIWG